MLGKISIEQNVPAFCMDAEECRLRSGGLNWYETRFGFCPSIHSENLTKCLDCSCPEKGRQWNILAECLLQFAKHPNGFQRITTKFEEVILNAN